MRRLVVLTVLVVVATLPATARADTPLCTLGSGETSYQTWLVYHMGSLGGVKMDGTVIPPRRGIDDAVKSVLGAQYANAWMDNSHQQFAIAFAPGPLDAAAAKQAVLNDLAAIFTPEELAHLDGAIAFYPVPYSEAQLKATMVALTQVAEQNPGIFAVWGATCADSDAWRVTINVADAETPELKAKVEALIAPFGDQVRVKYGMGWIIATPGFGTAPAPLATSEIGTTTPATRLRVRDYVTVAATTRCVKGKQLTIKAAKSVKSITVAAAGHRKLTLKPGKHGTVKLAQRRSTFTLTVTLPDGRTFAQQLTYRRC